MRHPLVAHPPHVRARRSLALTDSRVWVRHWSDAFAAVAIGHGKSANAKSTFRDLTRIDRGRNDRGRGPLSGVVRHVLGMKAWQGAGIAPGSGDPRSRLPVGR